MARVLIRVDQIGWFHDPPRWTHDDGRLAARTAWFVLAILLGWFILVVLAMGAALRSMSASPLGEITVACVVALTAWFALPIVQLAISSPPAREACRRVVAVLSLVTGVWGLGTLRGVWIIARVPGLTTDFLWEVTVPCCGLLLLGLVGVLAGARRGPERSAS
ncbi:hypothetical protein [Actinomyces sp. MRS3W]|uniref:hypothetical protein n=1 Tax=Actinomyces sp. MRS3W TaxID=2800796 RepID=UPI0028FD8303|nr:hypothetical protein [Actinomyces sp. MRS3W]MDU0349194.1 hypothetical protein [Actinomyces sp. MRS3W]